MVVLAALTLWLSYHVVVLILASQAAEKSRSPVQQREPINQKLDAHQCVKV
jgi:hypothetical protein